MVASVVAGCGSKQEAATTEPAAEETAEAAEDTTAADTADAAAEAAGDADLADKKVGVCIYQFADNFMTLFRLPSCSFWTDSAPSSHRGIAIIQ